jgi:hypothetical protein
MTQIPLSGVTVTAGRKHIFIDPLPPDPGP